MVLSFSWSNFFMKNEQTEGLAKILGMDTATVGEHLRRAEKHVFDGLLS